MNNVNIIGRLTKDPELKYSQSGTAIVRFTVAVNRMSKKEGQPEADFINCIAFQKQAENLANYQVKGNQIGVSGYIQTGSYEGQDGKRVYTTDVVANQISFLTPKQDNQQGVGNLQPVQHQNNVFEQPQNQFQQQPQQPQQPQQQATQYQQQSFVNQPQYAPQQQQQQVVINQDQLPF